MLAESYLRSGKVRDLFQLSDGRLAIVASDRISAFDVVLPSVIPDKGRVLTGLSRFWFGETAGIVGNHLLEGDDAAVAGLPDLRGRVMVCRATEVIPIEAVVRGFLAGSGWKEYRERGTVCGIALASGLRESEALPEPIFTPATKAEDGEHDENISFDHMVEHVAAHGGLSAAVAAVVTETVRGHALRLYRHGAAHAARRGILLADTKFEFGFAPGPAEDPLESRIILIDEVMTPDSSRFWDAATYEPGRAQASFDKQFVRDWLERQPWDKTAPGPALPDDVIDGTRSRYIEAYERVTGASFARYLEEDVIAP